MWTILQIEMDSDFKKNWISVGEGGIPPLPTPPTPC